MDISVDLPAPFSPMMPWMVPRRTVIEMSLFACTGPNALEMPRSSIAGASGGGASDVGASGAGVIRCPRSP